MEYPGSTVDKETAWKRTRSRWHSSLFTNFLNKDTVPASIVSVCDGK